MSSVALGDSIDDIVRKLRTLYVAPCDFLLARGSKRTIRMGLGSQLEHRIRLTLPTRAASHKMNYINMLLFR